MTVRPSPVGLASHSRAGLCPKPQHMQCHISPIWNSVCFWSIRQLTDRRLLSSIIVKIDKTINQLWERKMTTPCESSPNGVEIETSEHGGGEPRLRDEPLSAERGME